MSNLPTYNVPAPDPSEATIADSLSLQAARLRPVLQALAEEVTGSLADQQRAIDRVTAALRRRIRSGLRGQVQLLTPVMDAIHGQVAGSLAAQQVALATLMDQVTGPLFTGTTLSGTATPLQNVAPPGDYPTGGLPAAPVGSAPAVAPTGTQAPTIGGVGALACPPAFADMTFPDGHRGCIPPDGVPAALAAGGTFTPGTAVPPYPGGPAGGAAPTEPLPGTYPLPSDGVPYAPPGGAGGLPPALPPGTLPGAPQPQESPAPQTGAWPLLPLLPNWCSLTVCDTLDQVTAQVAGSGLPLSLSAVLDAGGLAVGGSEGGWLSWLAGGAAGKVTSALAAFTKPGVAFVDKVLATAVVGPDCAPAAVASVAVVRALAGFAEQWTGAGLAPLIRSLDYWIGAYCPTELPGVQEANACYLAGVVDVDLWRCWVRANGACDDPQRVVVEASRTRPSVDEEYRVWLRGAQSEQQLLDRLRGLGILHPEDEHRFRLLQQQLPTPSELVQWVVRESFDLDVVKRWGYDAERPDVAAPFFQAQGLTGQYQRVGSITGQSDVVNHLAMTWASHWVPLSPGQAYEMHHRIRGDNVAELQALGLNVQPFTLADVQSWLKIADYPEGVRDYLIATAYHPLRLIDIRNALILGVRDKQWAYRQFLGRGHSPGDAQFSADLAEEQARAKGLGPVVALERKALTWLVQEVQDSYELGTIDRASAANVLVQAGLSDPGAAAALDARDARARRKLVARAVSSVRRDFLSGAISALEAGQALLSAGVQLEQGQRYLDLWSIELGHARRVVSTQTAVQWLTEGLITVDQAVTRLSNLGWANPDIALYLAEAQQKVAKSQARAIKAAQQSQRAEAKELERVQKAAQAQADKASARLAKLTPVAKLAKWFALGYVTEPFIVQRMSAMGYTQESIALHLEEFRKAKEDAESKANGQAAG